MNAQQYYQSVIEYLQNCYQYAHYVIATGEAIAEESKKPVYPTIAVPVNDLEKLTVQRGLQVHLPIVGEKSQSVLMPLNIDIYLGKNNHQLYSSRTAHKKLFTLTLPCIRFVENILREKGMPYLLDYTPSGGHILFQNQLGYRAAKTLQKIGCVEDDAVKACNYIDHYDIRRWHGVSLEAASVFNGLGKLAEYIALLAMQEFKENEAHNLPPVTIAECRDTCISINNTWCEGSPFMRTIRSPFSLHKKNQEKYGHSQQAPLVNVIGTYFDGHNAHEFTDIDTILDCMWDLEKAADHAKNFTGFIPNSNETLIDFIDEYKTSDLYLFHRDFDKQEDIPHVMALKYARNEKQLADWTRYMLHYPNPAALQPKDLMSFVYDFLIRSQWEPKHIGNILRDLYQDDSYDWTQDFFKYPAEQKANFWARTYSAVALWETGRLGV